MIQFHQNVAGGFTRGDRLMVVDVDADGVQVSRADGSTRTLPLSMASRFSVYAQQALALSEGDRIRITQNGFTADGQHRLNNGSLYEVEEFTSEGDIRLTNGWVVDRSYGHLAHGYVTTSHASQGKSVDVVMIAQSAQSLVASNLEQFYVSVSRGKEQVRIYTDDREGLREAVKRSAERVSATELSEATERPRVTHTPVANIRPERGRDQARQRMRRYRQVMTQRRQSMRGKEADEPTMDRD